MSYNQNPYHQGPAQETGHGYGEANPYSQDQYELQNYSNPYHEQPAQQPPYSGQPAQQSPYYEQPAQQSTYYQQPAQRSTLSQQEYLDRVSSLRDEIKSVTADVDSISLLHQRILSSTDSQAEGQLAADTKKIQDRNTAIKDGIKTLEGDRNATDSTSKLRATKTTQLESLKTYFKSELDKYQSIERDYKQKYREQIARQYLIVNPDATEQEVEDATLADWGNEGVFQTALRSNRTGQAKSVLGNVRARHGELQIIERTLVEVANLYDELAQQVEIQQTAVEGAEGNAQNTVENIEKGNEQVKQANEHARRRRKLKWWCFFIVCLIILAIALGVGLGICIGGGKCK